MDDLDFSYLAPAAPAKPAATPASLTATQIPARSVPPPQDPQMVMRFFGTSGPAAAVRIGPGFALQ